jgi:CDP-diacylglycerol--glycerol-3-phosphate 3-phosphatidyltransferase
MTYTRAIGLAGNKAILFIVRMLALSKIHPNVLTFIGLLINIGAATLLATGRFRAAGWVIIGAGLFDMVDGRVARETNRVTRFGGFFDSVLDRYSDLALLVGLLVWYAAINRSLYIVLTAIVMTGSVMVSYTRARAENSIPTCKVGFMERPERIVLFMIGAFTNRMGAVLWVILILSIFTVADRIYYTYLVLNTREIPRGRSPLTKVFTRTLFWTDERTTLPYDLMVIAILAFVWLTPPIWINDPTAPGMGLWALLEP